MATAAMVCEVSYQEVRSLCFGLSLGDVLLDAGQMRRLVEAITQIKWRINWPCSLHDLTKFKLVDGPVVLLLQGDEYHHWIASTRNIVHDPAFPSAFAFDQYPRRLSKVFAFLRPVETACFNAYRARRRKETVQQLAIDLSLPDQTAP